MREALSGLAKGVRDPEAMTVAVDTASHARLAHQARLKHSKVWQSAATVPTTLVQTGCGCWCAAKAQPKWRASTIRSRCKIRLSKCPRQRPCVY